MEYPYGEMSLLVDLFLFEKSGGSLGMKDHPMLIYGCALNNQGIQVHVLNASL